jgi:hypothetical protein
MYVGWDVTVSLHLAPCPGTFEGEVYIPVPSVYTYAGLVYKHYDPHKQWRAMRERERERERDGSSDK